MFLCRVAPAEGAAEVVAGAEGDDGCGRVVFGPFGDRPDVVHHAADGPVPASDQQKEVGHVFEDFEFWVGDELLSRPSSRMEMTWRGLRMR